MLHDNCSFVLLNVALNAGNFLMFTHTSGMDAVNFFMPFCTRWRGANEFKWSVWIRFLAAAKAILFIYE